MRAKDFLIDGLMRPTTYKGWTYKTYDEDYDDVIKISHVAKKGDKEVSVDWSPYNEMTSKDFALWIDLGMPTRDDVGSVGPLTHDDLMTLANTKQGTHKLLQKEEKIDEILPALGAVAGRAIAGRAGGGALSKAIGGAIGSNVGSELEKKFNEDDDRPPATRDYMTKVIAGKIKPGLDPDGPEFEDQAYLYHTSELGRRDLMAQGGNWKAYYDAIKWHYKNANESVEEVKDPAKYLSKKLSDIETQKKFAKGEIRIPTPQERRAEIEKRKKEQELDETKKDACYHKVKSRYKVWPSAYASGALVQCRKKGAANWGNKSKK